ncbi:YbaB/EbfC family nucleoid-associated protein [Actinophytocola sediminis]
MNMDVGAGERRLADYMRRVGEIQQRAEETQAQLKTLRARVSSPDRGVSVELAPGGRLERLTISPEAMRHGPEQLAASITETVRAAHAAVAEQMQETLQPLIGDSPAMEFLRDQIDVAQREDDDEQAPQDPAEPEPLLRSEAPPPRAPRPTDDDDDEGLDTIWGNDK